MDTMTGLLSLPWLGAAAGLALWGRPLAAKAVALLAAVVPLTGVASGALQGTDPSSTRLMAVIAVAAVLALLGQQCTRQASLPLAATLALLGLSLAGLAFGRPVILVLVGTLMGALALLTAWTAKRHGEALSWGAAVGLGAGTVALAASTGATGGSAAVLHLFACAVLLPLFPFHAAFVGALSSLPGTLPAFLAVLLPGLGWHLLTQAVTELPALLAEMLAPLALFGALYVAVRASVQIHLPRALASVATMLIALVWWHVGVTRETSLEAGWFLAVVALASSGLLLAAHFLDMRYGSMSLDRLQGFARPMPRFATLVGLLLMAAMGLPIFGVFAGFLGLVATASSPGAASLLVVLLIWLAVSLLMVALLQKLLFRPVPPNLVHRDLSLSEMAALALIISLLAGAGMVPPDFLRHEQRAASTVAAPHEVSP